MDVAVLEKDAGSGWGLSEVATPRLKAKGHDGLASLASVAPLLPTGAHMLKTTPGLAIGQTFRWMALRDRATYKKWILDGLERERPTRMLFSHGVAIEGLDLHERLAALVDARL